MHRLEGRTFPEIARHLDVSVGFAHRLVKQALTHCANRLDEPGRPDEPGRLAG
jgi:RNA polymerase sigma-70 factor (ECF subfamily)